MTLFAWDATKFDVGVPRMNHQHKGLVDIMNAIHDQNAARAPRSQLKALLLKLATATRAHFAEEETFMQSLAFPDFRTHKAIHEQLLSEFGRHVEAFDKGDGTVGKPFFDFLSFWLRAHICHVDTKYGRLAVEKRAV